MKQQVTLVLAAAASSFVLISVGAIASLHISPINTSLPTDPLSMILLGRIDKQLTSPNTTPTAQMIAADYSVYSLPVDDIKVAQDAVSSMPTAVATAESAISVKNAVRAVSTALISNPANAAVAARAKEVPPEVLSLPTSVPKLAVYPIVRSTRPVLRIRRVNPTPVVRPPGVVATPVHPPPVVLRNNVPPAGQTDSGDVEHDSNPSRHVHPEQKDDSAPRQPRTP